MRILQDFAAADFTSKHLVILLPGALQQPEEFVAAGFVEAVRARDLPLDVTMVDLGIEYIGDTTNGSMLARIETTLIEPARRCGYASIWLGGISIGGLIAIAYADRFPQRVDGLCLLSPYPGNRILLREIEAAGGLDRWHAGTSGGADLDAERGMWRWLQSAGVHPRMHMGYGQQDRFAAGLAMMATALAAQRLDAVPGGHDWPTWRTLWENFLDQTTFTLSAGHQEDGR